METEYVEEIVEGLDHDILLSWKSTSGKRGHFRTETVYIASERSVINRTMGSVRRLWGLLPPKRVKTRMEYFQIPEDITTVDQLRTYVAKHKRHWLYERHRR